MKRANLKTTGILAAALLLALGRPALASLSISAEIDKTTLAVTESLFLTVTVSGDTASVPEPQLPQMDNFNVYSSGRSQNMSIINGRITTSVSFTYALSPRFLGEQKIPPITVTDGKETHVTPEITVSVVKSAGGQAAHQRQTAQVSAQAQKAAQTDGRIFLIAEPEKKTAYPNEQVNLSVRFFTSAPLASNPQYMPPQFKNLMTEDLPPVRNGETVIKGVRYSVSEIKMALFGIEEGEARIEPASVSAQILTNEAVDPFDPNFFDRFFGGGHGGVTQELKSKAAAIKIIPFPPGAPASFNGAVGSYSISAELDRKTIKAGEALNLSLKISGKGNLKILTAPKLPDMPDFKVYDTLSALNISKTGDIIGGNKVFTTILMPKTEGKRIIQPIKFAFFDPASRTYKELATAPMEVTVTKADGNGQTVSFVPGGPPEITTLGTDIRYVTDEAGSGPIATLAAKISGLPVWLNLIPVLLAALSFGLSRLARFKADNPLLFKFRKAGSKAAAGLDSAGKKIAGGQTADAVSILYDSFLAYLSDKTGQRVSGLTIKNAMALLKETFPRAGEHAMNEARELWQALEAMHFHPAGVSAESARELLSKYAALLPMLEKELKK